MIAIARGKYLRVSSMKMRQVIDAIRGKDVPVCFHGAAKAVANKRERAFGATIRACQPVDRLQPIFSNLPRV